MPKSTTTQNTTEDSFRNGTEKVNFDPQIYQAAMQGMQQFGGLLGSRVNAPINLQTLPGYSSTPSALTTNAISQGVQNIGQAEAARNRGLASSLSQAGTGNNSALLSALARQGQIASAGARNALIPQGFAIQRQLDQDMNNTVAQNNQQKLAARQLSSQEVLPYMNLLQTLIGLGQVTAGRERTEEGHSTSKTKQRTRTGLMGLF